MLSMRRIWNRISGAVGTAGRMTRAAFDAAKNTSENRKHWAESDSLDAASAMNPEVRLKLRNRSRYESANNPIIAGIGDTLACDIIGIGPSLEFELEDDQVAEVGSDRFHAWAEAVNLWEKSRVAERALYDTGEIFWLFVQNDALDCEVKLDVQLIEAERVYTPWELRDDPTVIDGIRFDRWGNPVGYYVAKRHPGSATGFGNIKEEFDYLLAGRDILHDFELRRPGQVRGIPALTPSLNSCAMLRRWSLAVVRAAEMAASLGAVLIETDLPPNISGEVNVGAPGTGLEFQRGQMTFVPAGSTAKQMKAEQPTSTHDAYMRSQVREIARPVSMPLNIALCDSSGYNYSSGRLDHQTYDRSIEVRQDRRVNKVLTPIFLRWHSEGVLISGYLPQQLRTRDMARPAHCWLWRKRPHVDRLKEANATEVELRIGTTTLRDQWGQAGKGWRRQLRQRGIEVRETINEGLTVPGATAPEPVTPDGRTDEQKREDGDDVE